MNTRSIEFLPEIFQTETNRKFLGSTLDQMIQEPRVKRVQGYIGRRSTPNISNDDFYVQELSAIRQNYQLEPSVVVSDDDGKVQDVITYPGILSAIQNESGTITNHDRMFSSTAYSWHPLIDFDKFVNYAYYYWLAGELPAVPVTGFSESNTRVFDIDTSGSSLTISGFTASVPDLVLKRGTRYVFNSTDPIYITVEPTVDEHLSWAENRSNGDVYGVTYRDDGTISFLVPSKTAQDRYTDSTKYFRDVDLAYTGSFNDLARQPVTAIDGIYDLDGRTIIFTEVIDEIWRSPALENYADYPSLALSEEVEYRGVDRYQVFTIAVVPGQNGADDVIELIPTALPPAGTHVRIQYGAENNGYVFYKTYNSGYWQKIGNVTATNDKLYYVNRATGEIGNIYLDDAGTIPYVDVNEITGSKTYTSSNGVTLTSGMKIKFDEYAIPVEYAEKEYYVEGVGSAIRLIPVERLVTPELHIGDNNIPDYITINRASRCVNPWARSNRWVHRDVVEKTIDYYAAAGLTYPSDGATIDNQYVARRPIVEFESSIRLFNYGVNIIDPVDLIETRSVDALRNVNGSGGYVIDGVSLSGGMRVIFAGDTDPEIRKKVYEVIYEDVSTDNTSNPKIILNEVEQLLDDTSVVVLRGANNTGITYRLRGDTWQTAQAKTKLNQPPLFDIFDESGVSISDYRDSTFSGTQIFGYTFGTGKSDEVLGFPLQYANVGNYADIQFSNYFFNDTFSYTGDTGTVTQDISELNYLIQCDYMDIPRFQNCWIESKLGNRVPQKFQYYYGGAITLDIDPDWDYGTGAVRVYVNGSFVDETNYTIDGRVIDVQANTADLVEIVVISDQRSSVGFYEVPSSLAKNAFNEQVDRVSFGTIRSHFSDMVVSADRFNGLAIGVNNSRDIGSVSAYGELISQQSAPLLPAAYFLRKNESNLFDALVLNAQEYEKYKNKIMNWVENTPISEDYTPAGILDEAISNIALNRDRSNAFYWSDMVPYGADYSEQAYEVSAVTSKRFPLSTVYDFTSANIRSVLVYVNDVLITKDRDYQVSSDAPQIIISKQLAFGDVVRVREYNSTIGAMMPSTPTKLGLYPRFQPEKFLDDTGVVSKYMIRGHDGSITMSYGDIRDDVLLELENRIYNNIKCDENIPITVADVVPGEFRDTGYTISEIEQINAKPLLSWISWNRLDYRKQDYRADNEKTWNYSASVNRITNQSLAGHWRGIYQYLYDTDAPHSRPWEMLGLVNKPVWWENYYGTAPYTSNNENLWDDIEAGLIREPNNHHVDERFARPYIKKMIPVGEDGSLLMPDQVVAKKLVSIDRQRSWALGDHSPVETAWRRSSAFPFAMQRLFALTKPAKYFALMIDRDGYKLNQNTGQYQRSAGVRFDFRDFGIDSTVSANSYVTWMVDYNKHYGFNSIDNLNQDFANIDVRLSYRMSGFTDKNKLQVFTDNTSPGSTNSGLLIPDESFDLITYRNQPSRKVIYSSVIVQRQSNGYAVLGNSKTQPYFEIMRSVPGGNYTTITVGRNTLTQSSERLPRSFTDNVVRIPYGYVFSSRAAVIDFLASYGEFLVRTGFQFDHVEDGNELNWDTMAREFLYWSDQGWGVGSVINLNPASKGVKFYQPYSVVDSIFNLPVYELPLDQNARPLSGNDYSIIRENNDFYLKPIAGKNVSYLSFNVVNYETIMVFDNTTVFDDVIYSSVLGSRQNRIRVNGYVTDEWNGSVNAPGFIVSNDRIPEWKTNKKYSRGDVVSFKNSQWSAIETVDPSDEFIYDRWMKMDVGTITTGLLPNLSKRCEQLITAYDRTTANLESDVDLFAFGITGFRPRDYLASLNLDDITQYNVYSDMIAGKGTINSMSLFNDTILSKQQTEYSIEENWAIRRSTYGATATRGFIELQLDNLLHTSNPSTVAIVDDGEDVLADQTIPLDDIYRQSKKHNDKNIIAYRGDTVTDTTLPTAGFVDLDEVDLYTFSLDSFAELTRNMDKIVDGSLLWVAKDLPTEWNVYRITVVNAVLKTVTDEFNQTATMQFGNKHTIEQDDIFVIKYFNDYVDGVYRVNSVPDEYRLTVVGALPQLQATMNGDGVLFKLESIRVAQSSDINTLVDSNSFFVSEKAWVDNDGNGNSAIFERQPKISDTGSLLPDPQTTSTNFGSNIAQSVSGSFALVADNGTGVVYFVPNSDMDENNEQHVDSTFQLTDYGYTDYGRGLTAGKEYYAVTAEGRLVIGRFDGTEARDQQIIESGDADYGRAVYLSDNEDHLYVSIDGTNSGIVAYGLVTVGVGQEFETIATGQQLYEIDDTLVVDSIDQVTVYVDDQQVFGCLLVEIDGVKNVSFNPVPEQGQHIRIVRNDSASYISESNVAQATYSYTSLYVATVYPNSLRVYKNNVLVPPSDMTIDTVAGEITINNISADDIILIEAGDFYQQYGTLDVSTSDNYGQVIASSSDGAYIAVTANNGTANEEVGFVYTPRQRVVVGDELIESRTIEVGENITSTAMVFKNGVRLNTAVTTVSPSASILSVSDRVIISSEVDLVAGDIIEIALGTVEQFPQTIASGSSDSIGFGSSLAMCPVQCSLYVGSPKSTIVQPEDGSVTRYVNTFRMTGVGVSVASPTIGIGDEIRINNHRVVSTGTTVEQLASDIVSAKIPNVTASTSNSQLIIELRNKAVTLIGNLLDIQPVSGSSLFTQLGFNTFVVADTITAPTASGYAHFGASVSTDIDRSTIYVGAPNQSVRKHTTFDENTTWFDGNAVKLIDEFYRSGVVYVYDILADSNILSTGKLVLAEQLYDQKLDKLSSFGEYLSVKNGRVLVSALEYDDQEQDIGRVAVFTADEIRPTWTVTRTSRKDVDTSYIKSVFLYDTDSLDIVKFYDYIDPLNGKILGVAAQNLDYISMYDPASYANGVNWSKDHVGQRWWDLNTVRFLDYRLEDHQLAASRWGKVFPGSSVDVYEWVESTVPPAEYSGGVFSTTAYSAETYFMASGAISVRYYFWAKNPETIDGTTDKTISAAAVSQYIENPTTSGIPYIALIQPNVFGIFNSVDSINTTSNILHIEYDTSQNEGALYSEYDLFRENHATEILAGPVYRKMIDSLVGQDTAGNEVPDTKLSNFDRYGISIRPRQSMFVDRYSALQTVITRINRVLSDYPVTETRSLNGILSHDVPPVEGTGQWDEKVDTYEHIWLRDLRLLDIGYKFLVLSDSNNSNRWAIYETNRDYGVTLVTKQSYDCRDLWEYVDWYDGDYDSKTRIDHSVSTPAQLVALTASENDVARVSSNGNGKWELYTYNGSEWVRVGLQDGTVKLAQSIYSEQFDQPYELRLVIDSVLYDIFTNELSIERNNTIVAIFNYIIFEQKHVDWLHKTSLINVIHEVGKLSDNVSSTANDRELVSEYIKEVKPYHSKINDYKVVYSHMDVSDGVRRDSTVDSTVDLFGGIVSDFDLPSEYNSDYDMFISPVLDDGAYLITNEANEQSDSDIWAQMPYSDWYQNRGTNLVRSIKGSMKFDRYEYVTAVVDWQANTDYSDSQLVRYNDAVYRVDGDQNSGANFLIGDYVHVPADELSGIDRTAGYYVDRSVERGRDLTQLIRGLEFPGVLVDGDIGFNYISGFGVSEFGAKQFGVSSNEDDYFDLITDAKFEGSFADIYLGIRPGDIEASGGSFVDPYHSYGPEELVTGISYDTLDISVYTRIGESTQDIDGPLTYAFKANRKQVELESVPASIGFYDMLNYPITIQVYNNTTGMSLARGKDYEIDWLNKNVVINDRSSAIGDVIDLQVSDIGGGFNFGTTQSVIGGMIVVEQDGIEYRCIDVDVVVGSESGTLPSLDKDYFVVIVDGIRTTDFVLTEKDQRLTRVMVPYSNLTDASFVSVSVIRYDTQPNGYDVIRGTNYLSETSYTVQPEIVGNNAPDQSDDFVFEIEVGVSGFVFSLPTAVSDTAYDATVDWGDGESETIIGGAPLIIHTYNQTGNFTIRISGTFPRIRFASSASSAALVKRVLSLGAVGWRSFELAFTSCGNMVDFFPGNCDTRGVTSMYYMFSSCTSLQNVALSCLRTETVVNMERMFNGCTNLSYIDVSKFGVGAVQNMSEMFRNCSKLEYVNVENWDTTNVSTMDGMFSGCSVVKVRGAEYWNIVSLTDATNWLLNAPKALHTEIYDNLLVNWAAQPHNDNVSVSFHVSDLYTSGGAGESARSLLITDGWTIVDGGAGVKDPIAVYYDASMPYNTYYVDISSLTLIAGDDATYDSIFKLNRLQAFVDYNGRRLRPSDTAVYTADGVDVTYALPATSDLVNYRVLDSDIHVFVNEREVSAYTYDDVTRAITFDVAPADGNLIKIVVTALQDYYFDGDKIVFRDIFPMTNDVIRIVDAHDVTELNVITDVFIGPNNPVEFDQYDKSEYDSKPNDQYAVTGTAPTTFQLSASRVDSSKIWVTVNGLYIANYEIDDSGSDVLVSIDEVLSIYDKVVVTTMTPDVVPEGIVFRWFKDMQNNRGAYNMNATHRARLTSELMPTDDVIYVSDASVFAAPSTGLNRLGIAMINGERITYRVRNLANNTLSGLRRGVAGTAVLYHPVSTFIYDSSTLSLLGETTVNGMDYGFVNESWNTSSATMMVGDFHKISVRSLEAGSYGLVMIEGFDYRVKFEVNGILPDNNELTTVDESKTTPIEVTVIAVLDDNGNTVTDYPVKDIPRGAKIYDMATELVWYDNWLDGTTLQQQNTIQANQLRQVG